MARGCFITFEGPEGAGKTTHIRRLADWLAAQGRECVVTREPGGTAVGEELRRMLKHHQPPPPLADQTEVLLFAAARAQHVHELIRPAVRRGAVVLCDRFMDSTTAYQGHARGLDLEFIRRLHAFAVADCPPDLTILLDLAVADSARRIRGRDETATPAAHDRFESLHSDFHQRVRDGFRQLAREEPERIRLVDASPPLDEVYRRIMEIVSHALGQV